MIRRESFVNILGLFSPFGLSIREEGRLLKRSRGFYSSHRRGFPRIKILCLAILLSSYLFYLNGVLIDCLVCDIVGVA